MTSADNPSGSHEYFATRIAPNAANWFRCIYATPGVLLAGQMMVIARKP
jgi:hypothetical protein